MIVNKLELGNYFPGSSNVLQVSQVVLVRPGVRGFRPPCLIGLDSCSLRQLLAYKSYISNLGVSEKLGNKQFAYFTGFAG